MQTFGKILHRDGHGKEPILDTYRGVKCLQSYWFL